MEYDMDIVFLFLMEFSCFSGIWYGYKGVFLFLMEYDMDIKEVFNSFLVVNGIWYGYRGVFLFLEYDMDIKEFSWFYGIW